MQRSFLLFVLAMAAPFAALLGQAYNPAVDIRHYSFALNVNDSNNRILGNAEITLVFKEDAGSFRLDLAAGNREGKGMTVRSVKEDDRPIRFTQDSSHLLLHSGGKAGQSHHYKISYDGIPADGLIIGNNKYGRRGFFGDNWPDRAHNWLPCIDHPSDKAEVDFLITAPDHYTVVANGALVEERSLPGHRKITHWKESVPLSPKVMVIGVADFAVDHPGDALGIPVWNYVYPEDKEPGFRNYALALQILPFYISHIGPYPFEKCGNVQSKTRFGGLENASAIFYFENSVSAPDVESLMAHEIAHQWFGDAATESQWKYLWLSEGFATYMEHCYLENKYGTDTLQRCMEKDRTKLLAFEKKRLTPVVDTTVRTNYMQLLNPNTYEKGGWALHMLRRRLGDSLFWKGIATYYMTYRNGNASGADFEKVMEDISGQDLHAFFHQWLDLAGTPSLLVTWKKDEAGRCTGLQIRQQQKDLYEFPLEYSVNGVLHTIQIRDRSTSVQVERSPGRPGVPGRPDSARAGKSGAADGPAPDQCLVDPNSNLLATFIL